jgi:hypothetical protein
VESEQAWMAAREWSPLVGHLLGPWQQARSSASDAVVEEAWQLHQEEAYFPADPYPAVVGGRHRVEASSQEVGQILGAVTFLEGASYHPAAA